MKKILALLILAVLPSAETWAMILYGAGNDATLENPGNGLPWNSVVNIDASGTAVHLGNGYFLTANHVNGSTVTTTDKKVYEIDTTFGNGGKIQIEGADLKIIKVSDPEILALDHSVLLNGILPDGTDIYHVGFGEGRGSTPLESADTPIATGGQRKMRWGTNTAYNEVLDDDLFVYATYADAPQSGEDPFLYTYEAALTSGDSGGPMFVEILGKWYVAGIAVGVDPSANPIVFGTGENANINYILRSADYYDAIYDIVPYIPEPAFLAAVFGSCAILGAVVKRRKN